MKMRDKLGRSVKGDKGFTNFKMEEISFWDMAPFSRNLGFWLYRRKNTFSKPF